MSLEMTILTADKRFHYTGISQVVMPTPLGQTGILPGHAPLISLITPGVLRISHAQHGKTTSQPTLFALGSGLARVSDDRIVLLMSEALPPDDIDREKTIARTRELASSRTSHAPLSPSQRQALDEEAAFHQAQLDLLDESSQSL